ncbi:MAG: HutD family protein, partial [Prevotella sp.]
MLTLTQSSYKTTTWKGGVTRQIFISPADGDLSARQFDVRISSAIIDDV